MASDLVTMQDQFPLDATRVVPMPTRSPKDSVKLAFNQAWDMRNDLVKEQVQAYNEGLEDWEQEWRIEVDKAWEEWEFTPEESGSNALG